MGLLSFIIDICITVVFKATSVWMYIHSICWLLMSNNSGWFMELKKKRSDCIIKIRLDFWSLLKCVILRCS